MTREEAIIALEKLYEEDETCYDKTTWEGIFHLNLLSDALKIAIEALQEPERVHARWNDSFDSITPYCTNCHKFHKLMTRTSNYCPNCGAIMDEEDKC